MTQLVLDRSKVEAHFAAVIARFKDHGVARIARIFLTNLLFGLVVFTLVVPVLGDGRLPLLLDTPRRAVMQHLFAPLFFAVVMTIWSAFSLRRMTARGPARLADHVEREHDRLSGDRWLAHVLRMGLVLLLVIGVPIGLLLAIFLPAPPPGRAIAFLTFTGITALWTIPGAFVIRWFTLRSYRRWSRSA